MSDVMLDKIRKLLAMAEDPACTPAEAEAFTAKATRLIADHGIDEALLSRDDPGPVRSRLFDMPAPYAREKSTLLSTVAAQLRCSSVLHQRPTYDANHRATNTFQVELFGHESDLRLVEMLHTSLLVQATRDVLRAQVPRGESMAAYRRTWWLGFAGAIGLRLEEAERAAAAQAESRFAEAGTSTAIVLADRRSQADVARDQAYPRLRTVSRSLSGSGGADGWQAGQRADLGRAGRVGANVRAAVGT